MGGEPDKEAQADENTERESWGIAADEWDAAFGWADDLPADGAGDAARGAADTAPGEPFKVWRCNWAAVECFMRCQSQWHKDAMGQFDGLRYPGVEVVMRRTRVSDKDAMFDKLQLMEVAALEVLRG